MSNEAWVRSSDGTLGMVVDKRYVASVSPGYGGGWRWAVIEGFPWCRRATGKVATIEDGQEAALAALAAMRDPGSRCEHCGELMRLHERAFAGSSRPALSCAYAAAAAVKVCDERPAFKPEAA